MLDLLGRRSLGSFLSRKQRQAGHEPHFIRDYRHMVRALVKKFGHDSAMQIGVGGNYEQTGQCEQEMLVHLGLESGQRVMDVGCGSGRLATALSRAMDVEYHGCDIVPEFLDYARQRAPASYRFSQVSGLAIPDDDSSADFVTFFSVATHLMHHETYLYLEEARRVARPGGLIVVSFLEFGRDEHWQPFGDIVESTRHGRQMHLNAFIESSVFPVWARRLGLELVDLLPLGRFPDPAAAPGESGWRQLGQSVAVLRRPAG